MEYTKKTIVVWDSLNEKLKNAGTREAYYQDFNNYLGLMVASNKTDKFEGFTAESSYGITGILESTERVWGDYQLAQDYVLFLRDLTAKYKVPETMISATIVDVD